MATYQEIRSAVIDLVDDFTKKDVAANYSPSGRSLYSEKTKLITLAINETMLAAMVIRFNKVMQKLVGDEWHEVGAFDLVQQTTIGGLIDLALSLSNTPVPAGDLA